MFLQHSAKKQNRDTLPKHSHADLRQLRVIFITICIQGNYWRSLF